MESFLALQQADNVRGFPKITMPAPLVVKKPKKNASKAPRPDKENVTAALPDVASKDFMNQFQEQPSPKVELSGDETQGLDDKPALQAPAVKSAVTKLDPTLEQLKNYVTLMDKYCAFNFMIYSGHALQDTPEYQSFKKAYQTSWGGISHIIKQIEDFLAHYEVKLAIVDGPKLYELSRLNPPSVSRQQIYSCIFNVEQIEMYIDAATQPGAKEMDYNDAVLKIQAMIRGMLQRWAFQKMLKDLRNTIKLQALIRRRIQRKRFKLRQAQLKIDEQRSWDRNRGKLGTWWAKRNQSEAKEGSVGSEASSSASSVASSAPSSSSSSSSLSSSSSTKRTVIFIPSISIDEYLRMGNENFIALQHSHITALCQLADPNISLVYISPVFMSENDVLYQHRMLSLIGMELGSRRLYFVTPELIKRLPSHLPLALNLYCSSIALAKVRFIMAQGAFTYISGCQLSWVEKRLAHSLDVPVLGTDPLKVQHCLHSRSDLKRLFMHCSLGIPIGAHDINAVEDLVTVFASLIAANLGVDRWIIKLNNDYNNESCAYFDSESLPVIQHMRKEQNKMIHSSDDSHPIFAPQDPADRSKANVRSWYSKHVQTSVRKRLLNVLTRDLISHICICRKDIFEDWAAYEEGIIKTGCVIEAEPLRVLGHVEALLFIGPDGLLGDEGVHGVELYVDHRYTTQGFTFPQMVTPQRALEGASRAVASELHKKCDVIGYVTIKYLSYWDVQEQMPRLWGLDVKFGMTSFFGALGIASVATANAPYAQPSLDASDVPLSLMPIVQPGVSCTYVPIAEHGPLDKSDLNSFFELCKMNGIGFDVESRVGSLFLVNSMSEGKLISVLCVADSRRKSINSMVKTLTFISQQYGKDPDAVLMKHDNLTAILKNIAKSMLNDRACKVR